MKITTKKMYCRASTLPFWGASRGRLVRNNREVENQSRHHQGDSWFLPRAHSRIVRVDLRFNAAWIRPFIPADFNATGGVLFWRYCDARCFTDMKDLLVFINSRLNAKKQKHSGFTVFKLSHIRGSINRTESGRLAAGLGFYWEYDRL